MSKISYYIAKGLKKLRGSAIIDSHLDKTVVIQSGSSLTKVFMGRFSYCGYNCNFHNVEIGPFCSIADHVVIGGGEHPIKWGSTSPLFYSSGNSSLSKKISTHERPVLGQTKVGADVWIGNGAKIKQGVNIGTGAVIGMGAVVVKDVEPYSIVGGVPAKIIGWRFDTHYRERLLNSRWWELSIEKLESASVYIKDVDDFLKIIESK